MSHGAALQANHRARCNHVSHGEPRWLYFGCAMQIINDKDQPRKPGSLYRSPRRYKDPGLRGCDKDSILVHGIKLHVVVS